MGEPRDTLEDQLLSQDYARAAEISASRASMFRFMNVVLTAALDGYDSRGGLLSMSDRIRRELEGTELDAELADLDLSHREERIRTMLKEAQAFAISLASSEQRSSADAQLISNQFNSNLGNNAAAEAVRIPIEHRGLAGS